MVAGAVGGAELVSRSEDLDRLYSARMIPWEEHVKETAKLYASAMTAASNGDAEARRLSEKLAEWADELAAESPDLPDVLGRSV